MSRLIALDVGDVRVGVALSDERHLTATPYNVYKRGNSEAEKAILKLISEEAVDTVIVGLPLSVKGEETAQSRKVRKFCERLKKRADIKVVFEDEYLSSEEAKQRLSSKERKALREHKKGMLDSIAASIILQQYLDRHLK